jgi:hypothetical protein
MIFISVVLKYGSIFLFLLISAKENSDNSSLIEKQEKISWRMSLTFVATTILLNEKEKRKKHIIQQREFALHRKNDNVNEFFFIDYCVWHINFILERKKTMNETK